MKKYFRIYMINESEGGKFQMPDYLASVDNWFPTLAEAEIKVLTLKNDADPYVILPVYY